MNQQRAIKIAKRLAEERLKKLSFDANAVRLGLPPSGSSREYEELKAALRWYERMLGEK